MLRLETCGVIREMPLFIFKTSNKYKVISLIKIWSWALSHLGTWKICFGHTFGIYTIFFFICLQITRQMCFWISHMEKDFALRCYICSLECCLPLNMLPIAFNLLFAAGGVDFISFSPICKNHNSFLKLLLPCIWNDPDIFYLKKKKINSVWGSVTALRGTLSYETGSSL